MIPSAVFRPLYSLLAVAAWGIVLLLANVADARALPPSRAVTVRVQHAVHAVCEPYTPLSLLPSEGYCKGTAHLPEGAILVKHGSYGDSSHPGNSSDDLDDYEETNDLEIYDPFEGWNRFWFSFNDRFYIHVADPLYEGWKKITPHQFRWALKNFLHNALFPIRFVNSLLQGKFKAAGVEFSRFMMDTMSSAGFSNPSKTKKTIVPVDESGEDFGQTLGFYGIGHGPYIVWPFVGPSSARDSIGRLGDLFAAPFFYVQPWWLSYATAGTLRFNSLEDVLRLYTDLRGAALDPYISMRDAYIKYRNLHVAQ